MGVNTWDLALREEHRQQILMSVYIKGNIFFALAAK
jgi:hypothetical protein